MADKYIIDTNSFVEPYKKFYAFDIAPSYWKQFEAIFTSDDILLLDVVYDEIAKNNDDLFKWLKSQGKSKIKRDQFVNAYGQIMNHIQTCGFYNNKALNEWANYNHADPWLVAAGIVTGGTVVTFETKNTLITGSSKLGKVRIGDIATHFGVRYENIYDFMREKVIKL